MYTCVIGSSVNSQVTPNYKCNNVHALKLGGCSCILMENLHAKGHSDRGTLSATTLEYFVECMILHSPVCLYFVWIPYITKILIFV